MCYLRNEGIPQRQTMPLRLVVALLPFVVLIACGDTSAAPSPLGHAGQWSGTTYQGHFFSFTVSPDQRVTIISIGYTLGACSGFETFSDVERQIHPSPPRFDYSAVVPDQRVLTIQVTFVDHGAAEGTVVIAGPPACSGGAIEGGPLHAHRQALPR